MPSDAPVRLITIPFSHYCEKARWALDRCGVRYVEAGHLPIFHRLASRRAGGGDTVPTLVAGAQVVADSTDIVAWADARRPGALLPAGADRAEALALEDDFDRQLGPASRRWAYFQLLPQRDLLVRMATGVPRWQTIGLRLMRPLAVALLRRGLNLDAAGAERSRAKIDATFARVAERLAGRRYLVGDRFTVADLTFAALAAPILLPPEYPIRLPTADAFTADARAQLAAWREAPAGRFALRLYRDERRVVAAAAPALTG